MAKVKQEKAKQCLDEAAGAEGVTKPREWVRGVGSFLFGFVIGYILIMVARQSVYAFVALILGTLGGTSLIRYFKAGLSPGWLGGGLEVSKFSVKKAWMFLEPKIAIPLARNLLSVTEGYVFESEAEVA